MSITNIPRKSPAPTLLKPIQPKTETFLPEIKTLQEREWANKKWKKDNRKDRGDRLYYNHHLLLLVTTTVWAVAAAVEDMSHCQKKYTPHSRLVPGWDIQFVLSHKAATASERIEKKEKDVVIACYYSRLFNILAIVVGVSLVAQAKRHILYKRAHFFKKEIWRMAGHQHRLDCDWATVQTSSYISSGPQKADAKYRPDDPFFTLNSFWCCWAKEKRNQGRPRAQLYR